MKESLNKNVINNNALKNNDKEEKINEIERNIENFENFEISKKSPISASKFDEIENFNRETKSDFRKANRTDIISELAFRLAYPKNDLNPNNKKHQDEYMENVDKMFNENLQNLIIQNKLLEKALNAATEKSNQDRLLNVNQKNDYNQLM